MGGSAVALPPILQNRWVGGERTTFEKPCDRDFSQWTYGTFSEYTIHAGKKNSHGLRSKNRTLLASALEKGVQSFS